MAIPGGVILYGHGTLAVAAALRELDSRYTRIRCVADGAEADAMRNAASEVPWLVVELYRPGADVVPARGTGLWLNADQVGPADAARAIDQRDLVLPSDDLWVLAGLRHAELCRACVLRHG